MRIDEYTDDTGTVHTRPAPPAIDAPIEARIAWLRADAEYTDRLFTVANRAFARSWIRSIRNRKGA